MDWWNINTKLLLRTLTKECQSPPPGRFDSLVHLNVHIPTGVRDGRNATLLLQYQSLLIMGQKHTPKAYRQGIKPVRRGLGTNANALPIEPHTRYLLTVQFFCKNHKSWGHFSQWIGDERIGSWDTKIHKKKEKKSSLKFIFNVVLFKGYQIFHIVTGLHKGNWS